jgi:hypothetical protein
LEQKLNCALPSDNVKRFERCVEHQGVAHVLIISTNGSVLQLLKLLEEKGS